MPAHTLQVSAASADARGQGLKLNPESEDPIVQSDTEDCWVRIRLQYSAMYIIVMV